MYEMYDKLNVTLSNIFQSQQPIKLHYKGTYKTGLCDWGYTRFCVMESTGNVVLLGKEKIDGPAALHIFNCKTGFQKIRTKPLPCRQHHAFSILPLMRDNSECLLVSCCDKDERSLSGSHV